MKNKLTKQLNKFYKTEKSNRVTEYNIQGLLSTLLRELDFSKENDNEEV